MLVEYCAPEDYEHERFMRGMRLLAKALLNKMREKQRMEAPAEVYENVTKATREGV